MATQTQQGNGKGAYAYKPLNNFDLNTEPDVAGGHYNGTLKTIRVSKTSKDEYPILFVEWTVDESLDGTEEGEKSVGATVSDMIILTPSNVSWGRQYKLQLRALHEHLGVDIEMFPSNLDGSKECFKDWIDEFAGKSGEFWVQLQADKNTNELRPRVFYTAPRGMEVAPSEDEEPAERHNRPAKKATAAKGKSARR